MTHEPSGIWLSDAEAIVLRSTIAQPIPQVASREERSELFLHLNSVQRIEVLHATRQDARRKCIMLGRRLLLKLKQLLVKQRKLRVVQV